MSMAVYSRGIGIFQKFKSSDVEEITCRNCNGDKKSNSMRSRTDKIGPLVGS